MKIIGTNLLLEFITKHGDARSQTASWIAEVRQAVWQTPQDIKKRFHSASIVDNNRVIFNLKGNKYRIDTNVYYRHQVVEISRVGTHAEYNTWE